MSGKDLDLCKNLGFERMMLHAKSLKFDYNGKEYFFETDLPEEFLDYLN